MNIGKCKLCLKDKKLVNSHIFSEFLYESVYDEKHKFKSVSDHPNHKTTKDFQKGFREHLLCEKCDNEVIQSYEDYAAKLLRKINSVCKDDTETIVIKPYDYTKFKLFILSLIWRCHIANNYTFDSINLNQHAEKIRRMLLRVNLVNIAFP
jgi:ribosome recycling factor